MTSRKPRKTDHGVNDLEALLNAVKAIKIDKKGLRATATAYKIPKSSLSRYIEKVDKEIPDIGAVDDEQLSTVLQDIASYTTPKLVRGFSLIN